MTVVVAAGVGGKMLLFVYVRRFFQKWQSYLGYQITHMAGAFGARRYSMEVQTMCFQTLLLRLCRCSEERLDMFNRKNAKKPDAFH